MRNGFNQFQIPYMNEITANQLGAASQFNGNTPLGFVNFSFDTISNFLQQTPSAPRTGRPEDFEEVIIRGRKVLRRKQTQIDQILTPPTFPQTPPIASGIRKCDASSTFFDRILGKCCIGEVVNGKCLLISDGKDVLGDDPTKSGKKVEGAIESIGGFAELSTRTVIILIGLILLIAAVVSMR